MLEFHCAQPQVVLGRLFGHSPSRKPRAMRVLPNHHTRTQLEIRYPSQSGIVVVEYRATSPKANHTFVARAPERVPLRTLIGGLEDAAYALPYVSPQVLLTSPDLPNVHLLMKMDAEQTVSHDWEELGVNEGSTVGDFAGALIRFRSGFSTKQWERLSLLGLTLVPENLRSEFGLWRVSLSPAIVTPGFH